MDAFSDKYSRGVLEGRGSLDLLNDLILAEELKLIGLMECESVTVENDEKPKEADA
jgi:hypothetical protein